MYSNRSWSEMELDCLVEIFMRLDLDDLTLAIPFVCKSWLSAARRPLCWKKLDFRQFDLLPWSNFSKDFTFQYHRPYFSFTYFLKFAVNRSCKSVTVLRFPLKFTSMEDLVLASNECPKLKHVALPVMSQSELVQIPQLVWKWKDLERLEMESTPSNFVELVKNISLNCRNFFWLTVSGSVREDDALSIVRYLPKLKKLELKNSYLPKKELMIILNGCSELEKLNLIDCVGFNGDDEEISAKVYRIKEFRMEGCKLYYEYDDYEPKFCLYDYVL